MVRKYKDNKFPNDFKQVFIEVLTKEYTSDELKNMTFTTVNILSLS